MAGRSNKADRDGRNGTRPAEDTVAVENTVSADGTDSLGVACNVTVNSQMSMDNVTLSEASAGGGVNGNGGRDCG